MSATLQCPTCKHFHKATTPLTCDAFPDGIPRAIITGEFNHHLAWPNAKKPRDNGIRYEPLTQYKDFDL